jgi:hypothetical protein
MSDFDASLMEKKIFSGLKKDSNVILIDLPEFLVSVRSSFLT